LFALKVRTMKPFIHLGHWEISTYILCLCLGILFGAFLFDRNATRRNVPDPGLAFVVAILSIAGLLGGRIYHCIEFSPRALYSHPFESVWHGRGLAWFGALLGALAVSPIIARILRMRLGGILDLLTPSVAIGYSVGRIGCLLAGDGDYGIPTSLPWGMRFPDGLVPTTQTVHPDLACEKRIP